MKFSNELAEICGIHAGDGYLRNDGKRKTENRGLIRGEMG